jgi:hypothetical protein
MDYLRQFADAGVAVLVLAAVGRVKDSRGRSSYSGDGLNLKWLGLGDNKAVKDSDMLMGLAELIAAIPDGLSVQAGLNPDGFDLGRPLATLEFLLRNSMEQLVEIAEREAGPASP